MSDSFLLLGGKTLGPSLSAIESASALRLGMPLRLADRILGFADGNIEHLLGKLGGITRTFGHEPSIAQARAVMASGRNSN